jgi:restriction system protein
MAQAWIIRAGRDDGYEDAAFDRKLVSVGWSAAGDLTSRSTLVEIRDTVRAAYPDVEPKSAESYAIQLFAFRVHMAEGDLVLLLRRTSPDVAVGWVTGPYRYRTDLVPGVCHVRSMYWSRTDLPRAVVERELLSLPALTMIFRINQADIVDRLRSLVGDADSGAIEITVTGAVDLAAEPAVPEVPESSKPFVNLQRNLNYARSLATAGQHLAQLQVGSFEVPDVFRAAWVQSVAGLDHWVRQEVRTRMLWLAGQSGGLRPDGFSTFPMTLGQLESVRQGKMSLVDALDQQLRETRSHLTYQHPDKIKEAFALVSDVKGLWDKVAKVLSEQAGDGVTVTAADVRQQLREIVHRRNKIAHEYDEDPANPPSKRPIDAATATQTIDWIEQVAAAILVVLDQD